MKFPLKYIRCYLLVFSILFLVMINHAQCWVLGFLLVFLFDSYFFFLFLLFFFSFCFLGLDSGSHNLYRQDRIQDLQSMWDSNSDLGPTILTEPKQWLFMCSDPLAAPSVTVQANWVSDSPKQWLMWRWETFWRTHPDENRFVCQCVLQGSGGGGGCSGDRWWVGKNLNPISKPCNLNPWVFFPFWGPRQIMRLWFRVNFHSLHIHICPYYVPTKKTLQTSPLSSEVTCETYCSSSKIAIG